MYTVTMYLAIVLLYLVIMPAYADNGCWSVFNNIHSSGGTPSSVRLEDCQNSCISNIQCVAIDWDPYNELNNTCWTLTSTSFVDNATNVIQYRLNRQCLQPVTTIPASNNPIPSVITGISSTSSSSTAAQSNTTDVSITSTTNPNTLAPTPTVTNTGSTTPALATNVSSTTSSLSKTTTTTSTTTTTTATASPSGISSSSSNSEGTSFMMVFPPEPGTGNQTYHLTVCTPSVDDVAVEVWTHSGDFHRTFTVSLAECNVVQLPKTVVLDPSRPQSFVTITSSNYITVQTTMFGSCASYTAIPESSLGTEYYISTLKPIPGDTSVLIVTATSDTDVTINVRTPDNSSTGTVQFADSSTPVTLDLPRTIQYHLGRGQSVYLRSSDLSLSGTRVNSTAPVSVLAGNLNASGKNFAVTQFPPTTLWGNEYVAATLPNSPNYTLIVISRNATANLVVDAQTSSSSTSGHIWSGSFNARSVYVASDDRILVVQYPAAVPTAILVPAVEHYREQYNFALTGPSPPSYVLLVAKPSTYFSVVYRHGNIESDPITINNTHNTTYMDGYMPKITENGSYLLISSPKLVFGAYIFGSSSTSATCAMGYSLVFSEKDKLTPTKSLVQSAHAIRPAYIVLAGLGGGVLLLFIVAVVVICSYPLRDEPADEYRTKKTTANNNHHPPQPSAAAVADEHEMNESNHHHHTAEVETNPMYINDEDSEVHNEPNYDNEQDNVQENPYFNRDELSKSHHVEVDAVEDDDDYMNRNESMPPPYDKDHEGVASF